MGANPSTPTKYTVRCKAIGDFACLLGGPWFRQWERLDMDDLDEWVRACPRNSGFYRNITFRRNDLGGADVEFESELGRDELLAEFVLAEADLSVMCGSLCAVND